MNKIKEKIIKKVGDAAVKHDWEKAFGGKSYGNRHLYRVNKIAKYLQSKEGGDLDIVLLGAWVHDVALVAGSDYDRNRVREETLKFLKQFKELDEITNKKVVECAVEHESEAGVASIEAKIVHDADALDKCGALGIIRHIWKTTNMLDNRQLTSISDLKKLEGHLKNRRSFLQTDSAKIIASELEDSVMSFFVDKEQALKWMKEISNLAWDGETSDKIAEKLIENGQNGWFSLLKRQLDCVYLR